MYMIKRSSTNAHARVPDSLGRLWWFFEAQHDAWRATNAEIERRDVYIVDKTRCTIFRKIHAIRTQGPRVDKLDFRASITVWSGKTTKSEGFARFRGISNDGPTVKAWRRQIERKIRQQGYRGHWQQTRWGPFGVFWKTLKDARAVLAEVKLLDNLRL